MLHERLNDLIIDEEAVYAEDFNPVQRQPAAAA